MPDSNDSVNRFRTPTDSIVVEAGEFLAGFRSLLMATVSADGVPDAAFAAGLEVTALHNHFLFDNPKVYFRWALRLASGGRVSSAGRGMVDTRPFAYYLTGTIAVLGFSVLIIESKS